MALPPCAPAPVATAFYEYIRALFPGKVYFLGICGDASHCGEYGHASGHCAGTGRELDCTDPRYAHAVDIGVVDHATALKILAIGYELGVVHYQIYQAVGYRPRHRGGARFASAGHDHHVHTSFGCGSTFVTDFGDELMAVGQDILRAVKELDDDLPEKALFERIVERQTAIQGNVADIERTVNAIARKLGVMVT